MTASPKTILYVDDDADDREIFAEAIRHVSAGIEIVEAEHGLAALDYLYKTKAVQSSLPCLIVLDLNMPYLDGRETLRRIKADAILNAIPVIVFSSSKRPHDKALFNDMGIEFFTKPADHSLINTIATHMVNICS